jgi:hypothetical protein
LEEGQLVQTWCGDFSIPHVDCLHGKLTMSFNVHGDLPTPLPDSFCLGFGQPKAGCFPVISGTINAGGIKLLLVNNPQDKADFTFYAHSNAIRIAELNLYGLSTADSPPWSATISVSSVDNDGFDDTIVTFPN